MKLVSSQKRLFTTQDIKTCCICRFYTIFKYKQVTKSVCSYKKYSHTLIWKFLYAVLCTFVLFKVKKKKKNSLKTILPPQKVTECKLHATFPNSECYKWVFAHMQIGSFLRIPLFPISRCISLLSDGQIVVWGGYFEENGHLCLRSPCHIWEPGICVWSCVHVHVKGQRNHLYMYYMSIISAPLRAQTKSECRKGHLCFHTCLCALKFFLPFCPTIDKNSFDSPLTSVWRTEKRRRSQERRALFF